MSDGRPTGEEMMAEEFGWPAVHTFKRIKGYTTRRGHELEERFAAAVGGTVHNGHGRADVITPLGEFEFRASANTKNASGEATDKGRGICVQACGVPKGGNWSGERFLDAHGKDPAQAPTIRWAAHRAAVQATGGEQMGLT